MAKYCPGCQLKVGLAQPQKQCYNGDREALVIMKLRCAVVMTVLAMVILVVGSFWALHNHDEALSRKQEAEARIDDDEIIISTYQTLAHKDGGSSVNLVPIHPRVQHKWKRDLEDDDFGLEDENDGEGALPDESEDVEDGFDNDMVEETDDEKVRPDDSEAVVDDGYNLNKEGKDDELSLYRKTNDVPPGSYESSDHQRIKHFLNTWRARSNSEDNVRHVEDLINEGGTEGRGVRRYKEAPDYVRRSLTELADVNATLTDKNGDHVEYRRNWRTLDPVPRFRASKERHTRSKRNPDHATDSMQMEDVSNKGADPQSASIFEECTSNFVSDDGDDYFNIDHSTIDAERRWRCAVNSLPSVPLSKLSPTDIKKKSAPRFDALRHKSARLEANAMDRIERPWLRNKRATTSHRDANNIGSRSTLNEKRTRSLKAPIKKQEDTYKLDVGTLPINDEDDLNYEENVDTTTDVQWRDPPQYGVVRSVAANGDAKNQFYNSRLWQVPVDDSQNYTGEDATEEYEYEYDESGVNWEPVKSKQLSSSSKKHAPAVDEEQPETRSKMWYAADTDKDALLQSQAELMANSVDWSVDPCDNFYEFACGNWTQHHKLPKDKGSYDTFEILRETLDVALRDVLESPLEHEEEHCTQDDAWIKAKNLYESCMNYELIELQGSRPLLDLLEELGGWPILNEDWDESCFDWQDLVIKLRLYNNDILIGEWVGPDLKNGDNYIIQFDQGHLGLPHKEHFLSSQFSKYLDAYAKFMLKTVVLLGVPVRTAELQCAEMIQFEKELANITVDANERNKEELIYERITVKRLKKVFPRIKWVPYLERILGRHVHSSEPVALFAVSYFHQLCELVEETPKRIVANYILWRFVRHRVNNLDDSFLAAKQEFYHTMVGREESPMRWKMCVAQVHSNMGMALGAMFVDKYFDESSKVDTLEMTKTLADAFRCILENNDWIDKRTKRTAVEKLNEMNMRIGYPEFLFDGDQLNCRYEALIISPDTYFQNTLNVLQHIMRLDHDRVGHVVNKSSWSTNPAVVNAYYSRSKNQIIFPAGILQPPFYHRLYPKALNYGGIGVVIGHEITHGFDDKGRLFDHRGHLWQWWSTKDVESFKRRASCLVDQYNQYVVEETGVHVNGFLTQGENIADNGGIKQAYDAYHNWLKKNDNEDESLPGLDLSGDQLFFLNFAQVWCGVTRPELARTKQRDPHAPGRSRVIGTVSNSLEFAAAFACPTGSPMNPIKKCTLW